MTEVLKLHEPELKFQIICANCHSIKTWGEGDYNNIYDISSSEISKKMKEEMAAREEKLKNFKKITKKRRDEIINSKLSNKCWANKLGVSEHTIKRIKNKPSFDYEEFAASLLITNDI